MKHYIWVPVAMMRRGGGTNLRAWAAEWLAPRYKVVYNAIGFEVYERREAGK